MVLNETGRVAYSSGQEVVIVRWQLLLVVVVSLLGTACAPRGQGAAETADEPGFPRLTGPYLGQPVPGIEPELFAPGIVSSGLPTRDVAMTPDGSELYFAVTVGGRSAILVTRQVDGVWTEPAVAPFSGRHSDIEPAISADGKRFFFLSNRPPQGQPEKPGWAYQDIWVMDRDGQGWGEPYNLGPPVNTEAPEFFPSLTRDSTLYFTREPGPGQSQIFRSRLVDGVYTEPERLPDQVNCGQAQFNAFVAPDESWIIVPVLGREDNLGDADYYVVFRSANDAWSEPVNMGESFNRDKGRGWSASLSPDGRYLFFMSSRTGAETPMTGLTVAELLDRAARPGQGSAAIYWVDAGVIETLRPG
jgi:hypothetical protein